MNNDEKLVFDHLTTRGLSLRFEPEGRSKPPDFLVDEQAALEVRRLNLNCELPDGSTEGIEVGQIPFRKHFDELLASFGSSRTGQTWSVFYRIKRRPIGSTEEIRKAILDWINAIAITPEVAGEVIDVGDWLNLRLYPYSDGKRLFSCGGGTDHSETIWAVSAVQDNIRLCAIEKLRKTAAIRGKYPSWWLGLVNHIHYDLPLHEQQKLRTVIPELSHWTKLLVISAYDPRIWYEV